MLSLTSWLLPRVKTLTPLASQPAPGCAAFITDNLKWAAAPQPFAMGQKEQIRLNRSGQSLTVNLTYFSCKQLVELSNIVQNVPMGTAQVEKSWTDIPGVPPPVRLVVNATSQSQVSSNPILGNNAAPGILTALLCLYVTPSADC